jgi:hypothetical protein
MRVLCPNCGKTVVVGGLGRKRLNISLKNICEALRSHGNVASAAKELGCSQGYVFNALKANGVRLKDVIDGEGHSLPQS